MQLAQTAIQDRSHKQADGAARWIVVSHVTMNFLGMGATLYFVS